jgi:hypothetical protein
VVIRCYHSACLHLSLISTAKMEVTFMLVNWKKRITLYIEAHSTGRDVKMQIFHKEDLNPDHLQLTFAGKILDDAHTMDEAGVHEGATIFCAQH